jgi:CHAD domain-containing protein
VTTCPNHNKSDDFEQLLARYFRQQRKIIKRQRKVILKGKDPEGVHQMRVALRRILSILATCDQQDSDLALAAKPLAKQLGRVRDMDVQLLSLKTNQISNPAVGRYRDYLQHQWHPHQITLVASLNGPPYQLLKEALKHHFDKPRQVNLPAVDALQHLLDQELRKTKRMGRKYARSTSSAKLHKLRLQCKKLRYLVDLFEDVSPEMTHMFAKQVHKLQSILGHLQDEQVAIEWLRNYSQTLPVSAASREDLLAIGGLIARHACAAQNLRQALPATWQTFDHKCTYKVLHRAVCGR